MNIEKRYAYVIIALLVLITGILIVNAYTKPVTTGLATPSVMGHSVNEVEGAAISCQGDAGDGILDSCNLFYADPNYQFLTDAQKANARNRSVSYAGYAAYATTAGSVPFTRTPLCIVSSKNSIGTFLPALNMYRTVCGEHKFCFLAQMRVSISDWGNPVCELWYDSTLGGWLIQAGMSNEPDKGSTCAAYCFD